MSKDLRFQSRYKFLFVSRRLEDASFWKFGPVTSCITSIAGFIFGGFLGIAFYFFILLDMELDTVMTLVLGLMVIIILALGNATSHYVRCVSLLTLPAAFGKTGRGILKTFAIAFVVAGPIANLGVNCREVIRVFGCTSQLTYNLTKTKYEILLKPFQDALLNMRHDEQLILDTLETVQDVVEPLIEEVEGQGEVQRLRAESDYVDLKEGDSPRSKEIEKKYQELHARRRAATDDIDSKGEIYEMEYKRKVEYRCEGVINSGTKKCRDLFRSAYDKCYETLSVMVAWLLCAPMKLTFMCNLVSVFGGGSICNPDHVIEPGFGKGYAAVKNSKNMFHENLGNVKIKYFVKGSLPKVDAKNAVEAANAAMQQFNESKSWFDFVTLTLKRVFALVFLLVIFKAAQYEEKYLTDIEFDNKYITAYFRKLDRRQRANGHSWLLPLKKNEAAYFINPYTILPDKATVCRIIKLTLLLMLEMLPVSIFFALDFLLYEILEIIATHAHVEFTQTGEHRMMVKVVGSGLVANLIRSLVRDLNVHQSVHVVHSNVTCLPRPSLVSSYYVIKVYGIYLTVWLMIVADGYSGRLNRWICACFYPKREKRRILYLYNETLGRRYRQRAAIMESIRSHAREVILRMEHNWFLSLRLRHPRKFGWLRWFSCGRRECLECGREEPVRLGKAFFACPTPGCFAVHCVQCFREIGGICYACHNDLDYTEEEDEDEDNISEV